MREFWNLAFSGLVTGAIYWIMASGLVLTYTTSGIFNFAHGAVAFATAYLYYQLNTGLGVPIVPALIIAVFVFAPLLGLLLDRILLRRLAERAGVRPHRRHHRAPGRAARVDPMARDRARQQRARPRIRGQRGGQRGAPCPRHRTKTPHDTYKIGGVVLNSDQIAVFVVAALAAILLWFVIRRTRVGLEMRAVRRPRGAGTDLRGVNAARTSAVGVDPDDDPRRPRRRAHRAAVPAPGLRVHARRARFACRRRVSAGCDRFPIAFAGGLLLGVIQNLVAGYSDDILPKFLADLGGLRSSVPYLLVIVLLLFIGRDRSRRGGISRRRRPATRPPRGPVEAPPPAAVGDLDRHPARHSRWDGSGATGCRPTRTTRP